MCDALFRDDGDEVCDWTFGPAYVGWTVAETGLAAPACLEDWEGPGSEASGICSLVEPSIVADAVS